MGGREGRDVEKKERLNASKTLSTQFETEVAFDGGSYCEVNHKYEEGWTQCDNCGKPVHWGCIMSLNTFEINDNSGITCKECIKKRNLGASTIGAPSLAPAPTAYDQLDDFGSFTEVFTGGELLVDPGRAKPLNDNNQNPDKAVVEGSLQIPQPPRSDIIFLFEKKLTPTDCDLAAGRFLVPKRYAEKFLPFVPGQQSMPITIKDTGGVTWLFKLRWWLNRNSRKYVLDGTKRCAQTMQWNAGDTLKFYKKLPENELIMDLARAPASTSGS